MTTDQILQLANLLSQLAPLGIELAAKIQAADADQLKSIADTLSAADANWDAIAAEAQAELDELAKVAVKPAPDHPAPAEIVDPTQLLHVVPD